MLILRTLKSLKTLMINKPPEIFGRLLLFAENRF